MSSEIEATPGRTGLSKELVLKAAIDRADRDGLEELSIRNLAGDLGVGAMTLYHYVADKDEIISGMVDTVLSEVDTRVDTTDWRQSVRRIAMSAHETLSRHPWAAGLMFTSGDGPSHLGYMESLLASLANGGFSPDVVHRAYHALDSHIIGFTLWLSSIRFDPEDMEDLAVSFMAGLSPDENPNVIEHVKQHLEPGDDEGSTFEFGLDLLLDSLERMRPAGTRQQGVG